MTQTTNNAKQQYRPEQRGDFWYVAKYNTKNNERIELSGMNDSFVYRYEALEYANDINRANKYPEAK